MRDFMDVIDEVAEQDANQAHYSLVGGNFNPWEHVHTSVSARAIALSYGRDYNEVFDLLYKRTHEAYNTLIGK